MSEVEKMVFVDIGLRDMEIGSNQGYQDRVEKVVNHFMEDL